MYQVMWTELAYEPTCTENGYLDWSDGGMTPRITEAGRRKLREMANRED